MAPGFNPETQVCVQVVHVGNTRNTGEGVGKEDGEGKAAKAGVLSCLLVRRASSTSSHWGKQERVRTVLLKVSGSRTRLSGAVTNLLSISFVKDNTNVLAMSNCSPST